MKHFTLIYISCEFTFISTPSTTSTVDNVTQFASRANTVHHADNLLLLLLVLLFLWPPME